MHPIDRACHPSIDITSSTSIDLVHTTSIDLVHTTSIDIRSKPKTTVREKDKFNNEYLTPDKFVIFRDPDGHARAIDGRILNVSRKDIADILQTANGAENLFVHQHNTPEYQQKDESSMMQLDGFWQVVKEEKLQEGDFEVESLISFGGSHWCRSTPEFEHRSTSPSPNRSTGSPEHRPMTPTESTASCNAVRVLTHEEFAAKHPHPPNPDNVRIGRRDGTPIDRQTDADIDR
ncbi:hypothetical protein F2Q69_00041333 [Brassica cretica]|uniref:Uncharacterized protein n=1 Tax=Brassica cretica TaxID=69181 RepID=A0A8S9NIZ8_BRACR|nr:hypothetical protein F2Q69_00041333 [Brassica cretica]